MFLQHDYPNLTNEEYQTLIRDSEDRNSELFNSLISYFDEKVDNFLDRFSSNDYYYDWTTISAKGKRDIVLMCIQMDLSCFEIPEIHDKLIENFLKIVAEKLRRRFENEDKVEMEEIVVDPEYQDLLDEALAIIDGKE